MAAAAAVTPLGLLHMRPLQHWLHAWVPRWAWQSGMLRVQVTPACRQTFTPWSDLSFLWAGVPLEQVSRHAVVYTDASTTGWGATFNGLAVSGVWTGPQLHWHINCLELLAVHLALNRLKRRLRGEHVLVRTSTDKVVYAPVACRNSPATSSSGVGSIWGRFAPFIFRACSTGQPTICHELRSPESGDSIPRRSSWFATFWTRTGRPVRVPRDVALPVVLLPAQRNTRHGRTGTVSMHFPQWAFSHRHCARSGRKRSRSSWRHTGPPGLGSQSWCSSWQPLPGRFLWGRIYWLRDGAPYGTRVQTSGNFMSGPWTGRGGSRWPTPRGSWHHHFGESTVYETRLRLEVEPVHRMVLLSQRSPLEMPDQSRAVLLAARVGAKAVSLHPQGLRGRNCCQPRPCGREVVGEAWLGRQVP